MGAAPAAAIADAGVMLSSSVRDVLQPPPKLAQDVRHLRSVGQRPLRDRQSRGRLPAVRSRQEMLSIGELGFDGSDLRVRVVAFER